MEHYEPPEPMSRARADALMLNNASQSLRDTKANITDWPSQCNSAAMRALRAPFIIQALRQPKIRSGLHARGPDWLYSL
jgi:hypothetical protein